MTKPFPILAGLTCRCPICGKGPLFAGFLKIESHCDACGADLSRAESGDGPVVFILLLVGIIGCGGLIYTELTFHPDIWVELTIWIPVTGMLSIGVMRPFKSLMIAAQFHFKASEAKGSDIAGTEP